MPQMPRFDSHDDRIIIHFDYDCFYASVVEHENPALKFVPLAIQQKQIVVTCNYEARRRGLYKLQLITEAKKVCPDAVIVLGEDLTRFRNASKELSGFLTQAVWSQKAERLGFDEVWLDCTDMIKYNMELLNPNNLTSSFFCMDKEDPTTGFKYDASSVYGCTYPKKSIRANATHVSTTGDHMERRLVLASHLARHLRHELESQKGYTATVGIATNKLLSKLIGNVNKPKNQTTLMPMYEQDDSSCGPVLEFMDSHDIGKVPGIGFKLAQKIREYILGRAAAFDFGLVYGGTRESVTVRDVRLHPGMSPEVLEGVLGGPGALKGIGGKIWGLLHGVDDSEVSKAKKVPTQISQEDSYMKYLHTVEQVRQQLFLLSERLVKRMRIDLTQEEHDDDGGDGNGDGDGDADCVSRRWLAHPRTLRLSTRPRPPANADGTRSRTFQRISRSAPMPHFAFSLSENTSTLADRLVEESLLPMFRKLHPQRSGWNLSLINIAVTNMAETAADDKDSEGRDIGKMFKRQDDVLRDFKVTDVEANSESVPEIETRTTASDRSSTPPWLQVDAGGDESWLDEWSSETFQCHICDAILPVYAAAPHERWHVMGD